MVCLSLSPLTTVRPAAACQLSLSLRLARISETVNYVTAVVTRVTESRSPPSGQRISEQDGNSGMNTLYGEFTATSNRKVRCAVSLTDRDFIVQRLTSAPVGRNKVVLSLNDCVGCRAYREDDKADPAAYLAVYFYPLKRRLMSSRVSRQRMEQCFRLAALQDSRANLEEAEKWARAIRARSDRQQYPRDGERRGVCSPGKTFVW